MQTVTPTDSPLPENSPPFLLEVRHEEVQYNGAFTPSAAILLTPMLRASNLMQVLDAEECQTLLLVLSCVTPNGSFIASPELLAPILGASNNHMLTRLRHLADLRWMNEPILLEQKTESGLHLFVPSPHLLRVQRNLIFPAPEQTGAVQEVPKVLQKQDKREVRLLSREAAIAYSRARYGRPRAEVEAQIEEFLRGEIEPSTPQETTQRPTKRKLFDYGLTGEQADRLLNHFPLQSIENQLSWLPYRDARNPAGLLIASIEGNYGPPSAVRQLNGQTSADESADPMQH